MLEFNDVSHVYANGTRAHDHVALSIPRGMYGLRGPNGAGKSTLMRTVATLQTPTQGSIRFGDIDVIAEPEKLRRTLGYASVEANGEPPQPGRWKAKVEATSASFSSSGCHVDASTP